MMMRQRCSRFRLLAWGTQLLLLVGTVAEQMESPLKGYGTPSVNTTAIFVSVLLDRILSVDDKQYRHENVLYFYLSWYDPRAEPQFMKNLKDREKKPNLPCKKYCSNTVDAYPYCCDGIYLPSFTFKNVVGFGQDSVAEYNIYVDSKSNVLWETRLHGTYYQHMDFRNHPFDSFDLVIDLKYEDMAWMTEEHMGIMLLSSYIGRYAYAATQARAQGSDSNSWGLIDMAIGEYWYINTAQSFNKAAFKPSHKKDPFPLSPAPRGQKPLVRTSAYEGIVDRRFLVFLTVERFWRPSLLNFVLPVVLVAFLAMFVFFLDTKQLNERLQIIVGLFLALTAVQFVLKDGMPTSSYIMPIQQLVVCTYVFLFILSLESIAVYWIANWKTRCDEAKRRWKAFKAARRERAEMRENTVREHEQQREVVLTASQRAAALRPGENPQLAAGGVQRVHASDSDLSLLQHSNSMQVVQGGRSPDLRPLDSRNAQLGRSGSDRSSSSESSDSGGSDGSGSINEAVLTSSPGTVREWALESLLVQRNSQAPEPVNGAEVPAASPPPPPRTSFGFFRTGMMGTSMLGMPTLRTSSGRMATDNEYAAFVAHYTDIAACAACAVLYSITTIIIFTTKHGYINLWSADQ